MGDGVGEQHRNLARKLVTALQRKDGDRKRRPVHTFGTGASGHFIPSPVAATFCDAEHFRSPTPATIRFSNGSGSAVRRDGWSDVRGMATRFHLSDNKATDLIGMTLPVFFTPDGESFLKFAIEARPKPCQRATPWQKFRDMLRLTPPAPDPYEGETISPDAGAIAFAHQHDYARAGVFQAATIGAPQSYARAAYHAVHSFVATGADGTRRWVRFSWQPVSGVLTTNPEKDPVIDDYLQAELARRLHNGPALFSLMMQIGEVGDEVNNPTRAWPPHRVRIMMGTLYVERMLDDVTTETLSFNPHLLTRGIAPSDDPVLWVRKSAYEVSSGRRRGTPCPFHGER